MKMDILNIIFLHTLYSSLVSSILIILLLLTKKFFYHNISARIHHILWILVLARLLIPVQLESPLSIFNLLPENINMLSSAPVITSMLPYATPVDGRYSVSSGAHPDDPNNEQVNQAEKTPNSPYQPTIKVLSGIWLTGFLLLAVCSFIMAAKFRRKAKSFKELDDPEIIRIVKQCCQKLNIKKIIPVYIDSYFISPCISGTINPRIYLPPDICINADHSQLQYVFLHELAHYKRKDSLYSFLTTLAAWAHWFNPLIWYAVKKMRLDREIACDAYVMETIGEKETLLYGMTIINLSNWLSNRINYESFLGANSQLERRIKKISMFKNGSYKLSAIVVISFLLLGIATLTNAVGSSDKSIDNAIKEKLVVIDPGHGGNDPGAFSYYSFNTNNSSLTRVTEKDLNLTISLLLYDMLQKSGIRVELTRRDDRTLELADRVALANSLNPSLLVSIHNNASTDGSKNGTSTLFSSSVNNASTAATGERAALLIQEELVKDLGTADDGLHGTNNLVLLKNTKMPTVITQIAYITNRSDMQKLRTDTFQIKAAQALHDGIIKVLKEMAAAESGIPKHNDE